MADRQLHVVTGAFGFSGSAIAARLLEAGHRVRTLTASPRRASPLADRVEVHPFHFDAPEALAESLRGATVLYNTYWVRFNADNFTYAGAVRNSHILFEAARRAGVGRIVHTSITKPSADSPFAYFRGKAEVERALAASGLPHTILRPAVLFGPDDILINNIAWALRRLPVFGVFGDGRYRLQPIFVEDFAELAVRAGRETGNRTIDATGPETFTYRGLVEAVGQAIGRPRRILSVSPATGLAMAWVLGRLTGDVMLTREEIGGLMADLLATDSPPAGWTRLTDWARARADTLGRRYRSELARRRNRDVAYGNL
jgi:uncharacterized protein YbjT (DUF2867 family)